MNKAPCPDLRIGLKIGEGPVSAWGEGAGLTADSPLQSFPFHTANGN